MSRDAEGKTMPESRILDSSLCIQKQRSDNNKIISSFYLFFLFILHLFASLFQNVRFIRFMGKYTYGEEVYRIVGDEVRFGIIPFFFSRAIVTFPFWHDF